MAKAREAEDGELPLDFTSCRSLVALGSTAKGEGQTLDYSWRMGCGGGTLEAAFRLILEE